MIFVRGVIVHIRQPRIGKSRINNRIFYEYNKDKI